MGRGCGRAWGLRSSPHPFTSAKAEGGTGEVARRAGGGEPARGGSLRSRLRAVEETGIHTLTAAEFVPWDRAGLGASRSPPQAHLGPLPDPGEAEAGEEREGGGVAGQGL